jgi:hypothetical protein
LRPGHRRRRHPATIAGWTGNDCNTCVFAALGG